MGKKFSGLLQEENWVLFLVSSAIQASLSTCLGLSLPVYKDRALDKEYLIHFFTILRVYKSNWNNLHTLIFHDIGSWHDLFPKITALKLLFSGTTESEGDWNTTIHPLRRRTFRKLLTRGSARSSENWLVQGVRASVVQEEGWVRERMWLPLGGSGEIEVKSRGMEPSKHGLGIECYQPPH